MIPLAATRGQPWTLIRASLQAVLRMPAARRGHLSGMVFFIFYFFGAEVGDGGTVAAGPRIPAVGTLDSPLQEAALRVRQQGCQGDAMPGKLTVPQWP